MRPVPDAHVLSREELVKLVQTVFLLPGDNSPRVVVFTGAESAAGCSSICAGAAEALAANVDEPVCLVDSNLRYPSLHLCLGVENNKGLGEALAGSEPIQDYVRKLPGDSMCLLSAGHVSSPDGVDDKLQPHWGAHQRIAPDLSLYPDGFAFGECLFRCDLFRSVGGWGGAGGVGELDPERSGAPGQGKFGDGGGASFGRGAKQADLSDSPADLRPAVIGRRGGPRGRPTPGHPRGVPLRPWHNESRV